MNLVRLYGVDVRLNLVMLLKGNKTSKTVFIFHTSSLPFYFSPFVNIVAGFLFASYVVIFSTSPLMKLEAGFL
jgi:hypothetical protein